MRLFEIPMVAMSLFGFGLLSGLDAPPARADFTFGEPINCGFPPGVNSVTDCPVCLSGDGLEMYITSPRGGGQGGVDIWVWKRTSVDDDWGPPENLAPLVNSASDEGSASISADGLELYFSSNRPGGYGMWDIYVTKRATRTSPWGPPTNLGPKVNSADNEGWLSVSSDDLELYFASDRPGGSSSYTSGPCDLYVSKRATTNDPWGDSVNLGPAVNSPAGENAPCLSPDGLRLVFQDGGGVLRPGGYGSWDLWMTSRASRSAPWEPVANLGPTINGPSGEGRPCFAPDGSALYFMRDVGYWKATILPIVDFNGDGKVDLADMTLLEANVGKSNPLYDIGPYAWGDGVVDMQDLWVFVEYAAEPAAKAADVPANMVLTWVPPWFSQTHDVYFGTSFEDVNVADRDHPMGVLVSEGQTATTYDPAGLLEWGRTYFWRIDEANVPPDSTVSKGDVRSFTVELFSYPVKPINATASSVSNAAMGPIKTIDGSGLSADDEHGISSTTMWVSKKGQSPAWIEYEFDRVYTLDHMWVWNGNQASEPTAGLGAKDVTAEYSTDGTTWTALAGVPQFAQATGLPDYVHNTTVDFGGVQAKFVKLTVASNWGGKTVQYNLSEVRFYYIPERQY